METAASTPSWSQRKLSRLQYEELIDQGWFDDVRAELLHGRVVRMSPQKNPHALAVEQMTELLVTKLRRRARIRVQLPIALSEDSEPEPDFALVSRDASRVDHPQRALLIIEVSYRTLAKDCTVKAKLYAENNIPEYWVVDVAHREVVVYTQPVLGQYKSRKRIAHGAKISPLAFPKISFAVADFLP